MMDSPPFETLVETDSTICTDGSPKQYEDLLRELEERTTLGASPGPREFYQLFLVLCDIRPACLLGSHKYVGSKEAADVYQTIPESYTQDDPVSEFLTEFEIPHVVDVGVAGSREDDRIQVSANYFIAFDTGRLERIDSRLGAHSEQQSPDRDSTIGQFLGYPETAIQEWNQWNAETDDTLFDHLTDEDIYELLGPVQPIVERLDVEPVPFMEYLLPYVVPAAVDEDSITRVINDFAEFLAPGVIALTECDIDLISPLISEYRWNNSN